MTCSIMQTNFVWCEFSMYVTGLSIKNSPFILGKTRPKVYGVSGTKRKVTKESSLDTDMVNTHKTIPQLHTLATD